MGNYLNITQVVFIIFQDGVMVTSGKGKNMKKINFILVTLVVIFNINLFMELFFYNRCCKRQRLFFLFVILKNLFNKISNLFSFIKNMLYL